MGAREQGALVDRLMARIGELEAKLYNTAELSDAQFTIPAIHGPPPPPPPTQLSASVDRQLLDSLGDPDKAEPSQQAQGKDWRAAASSWLASTPLARSALSSLASTSALSSHTATEPVAAAAAAGAERCSSTFSRQPDTSQLSCVSDLPATAKTPRPSSSSVITAPSSSSASFTFHPKQQVMQQAAPALQPNPSTAQACASSTDMLGSSVNHPSSRGGGDQSSSHAGRWGGIKSYYRYIMSPGPEESDDDDPPDIEVQRVQEAAGAALAEANERLVEAELRVQAAQAAQRQLQQRLEAAEQLQQDVEQLKTENLEAWRQKYELERQLAAHKANMDGMEGQANSMQQELADLRQQAQIWCDTHHSEGDKVQAEVELLNTQLVQRSSELSSIREQLTQARAERDTALQQKQQAMEERDRLQQQLQQLSNLQQQLSGLQQQLEAVTCAAAESAVSAAEFQEKFIRERAVRRRLHEQLQVLRGNIRVLCRVRPPQKQSPKSASSCISSHSSSSSCISVPMDGLLCVQDVSTARLREFEFDAVFGAEASQQQVFEEVAPLVRSCADGYNACILAYGQTGSGKTWTMQGPADQPGINTRALQELFKIAAEEGDQPSPWSFRVAMMEIYNEAVRDLLALAAATGGGGSSSTGSSTSSSAHSSNSSSPSNSPPGAHAAVSSSLDVSGLPAREVPTHMDRVPGLVWRDVGCAEEVSAVLKEGWRARATAATALNAASSRSHALLCVKIRGVREGRPFTSLLYLVDLAGSERVDKVCVVTEQQLKETQAINKSLSALGDVIAALQRRSPHIPFRNSKLTQVLQDSLCGSSKVLLVCNLSPEAVSCSETLSSLNFASRAAQVELGQARRVSSATAAAAGGAGLMDGYGQYAGNEPSSSSSSPVRSSLTATAVVPGSSGGGGGGGMRAKSPVSYPGSPSGASGRSSAGGGLFGTTPIAGRPTPRLSERASAVGLGPVLSSSGGSLGSPRVSSMAKPARH